MNQQEAKEIINQENLSQINIYDENNLENDQVCIKKQSKEWQVFSTDGNGEKIEGSEMIFKSEDDALDVLIKRARYKQRIAYIKFAETYLGKEKEPQYIWYYYPVDDKMQLVDKDTFETFFFSGTMSDLNKKY